MSFFVQRLRSYLPVFRGTLSPSDLLNQSDAGDDTVGELTSDTLSMV